jgi:hypothetical protein
VSVPHTVTLLGRGKDDVCAAVVRMVDALQFRARGQLVEAVMCAPVPGQTTALLPEERTYRSRRMS